MIQIIEQTHDERVKMYMRLQKKTLVEMLVNKDEMLPPAMRPGSVGWTGSSVVWPFKGTSLGVTFPNLGDI